MDYKINIKSPTRNPLTDPWIWKMAYRDAKNNFSRLFLFVSAIIIGIAALVAINSFHHMLQKDIDHQAKDLLGADLLVESNRPFEQEVLQLMDSFQLPQSKEANFASMVLFKHSGETRLIRVVALKGGFPYYGEVETNPENKYHTIFSGPFAILDESLASQYNVSTNDTIGIGNMEFMVQAGVVKMPGSSSISATFTPSIYISLDYLDSTGLVQFGSRVNYHRYFKTASEEETEALHNSLRPVIRKFGHDIDTVEDRKESLGRGLANLYKFFNLLAFIALILGCIGIASSVHIYAREKRQSVAVLRCMGVSGWQAFSIFFVQIVVVGLLGSLIGVLLGVSIQLGLPLALARFFPLEMTFSLSYFAILEGMLIGLIISVLFAVLPLLSVRFVPPLSALRIDSEGEQRLSKSHLVISILVILFPLVFATYQSEDLLTGSLFFGGLLIAFGCLYGVGIFLIKLVKKYFPSRAGFILRQALSNLFRPNNQTVVLVIVIGLGAFLMSTLHLVQTSLLNQIEFAGEENQSNTILFDIQPSQKEGVVNLTEENNLEVKQLVPIVTCRISSINGKSVREIQEDTTDHVPNWSITREYRVTYRDSLHASEELLEGNIHYLDSSRTENIAFVSISEGMRENLDVNIGDTVVFDVQGIPINTIIGGIRSVDWPNDPPNFIFVFPTGILEEAPQIFVLTTRINSQKAADKYSREIVARFPNISLIDLRLILKTIDEFFKKVSFVIEFMALFSIITGLIVLAGAVINSKYARMKENVLLRTLGAVKKQITRLTIIEYAYLGTLAGLTGVLLSVFSGWALSLYLFEVIFLPEIAGLLYIWISVTTLTILVGWWNTRGIINHSPLEVLRKEV